MCRDETKTELFGHSDNRCVWESEGEASRLQNAVSAVKYGVLQ